MPKFSVIIPAAGKSSRFRDQHYKKPFATLDGRAVWLHAADKFLNRDDVTQVILVISPDDEEQFQMKFGANVAILGVQVVKGGADRADSVVNALARVQPDVDFVAVHDAARPCLADEWIDKIFAAAVTTGAAMLAIPITSTVKRVDADHQVQETVPRDNLWLAQTPQVFRRELLVEAYAQRGDLPATDDAQLVERLGHAIKIVPGSPINLKITTKEDLRLAQKSLQALPKPKLKGPLHPFENDDHWR